MYTYLPTTFSYHPSPIPTAAPAPTSPQKTIRPAFLPSYLPNSTFPNPPALTIDQSNHSTPLNSSLPHQRKPPSLTSTLTHSRAFSTVYLFIPSFLHLSIHQLSIHKTPHFHFHFHFHFEKQTGVLSPVCPRFGDIYIYLRAARGWVGFGAVNGSVLLGGAVILFYFIK